jgi:predicted RNase H-like HicB family nuclease
MPERFLIELDREEDGRWIADVVDLPGVLVYGETREDALARAEALALRVLADRLEHGEEVPEPFALAFVATRVPGDQLEPGESWRRSSGLVGEARGAAGHIES